MQAVKQPVTLESFGHWEALKIIILSDELWLIISVALLTYFVVTFYFYIWTQSLMLYLIPNADIFRYSQVSTEYGRMFKWMRI